MTEESFENDGAADGESKAPRERRRSPWIGIVWGVTGLTLLGLHVILLLLSGRFVSAIPTAEKPIVTLVILEILAGVVFLVFAMALSRSGERRSLFTWMVIVGAGLRLITFFSTPMLENDYQRYLWDGAVTAHGWNPYTHAPRDVRTGEDGVPEELHGLALESGPVADGVNHDRLRTIYPPVAQGAFALAHGIRPFSLHAWRAVLLVLEVALFFLLVLALRSAGRSVLWASLYWWNPLVVKEVMNSAHMEGVVLPLAFLAVYLAVQRRHVLATLALAVATGAKVWPVLFLPILLRPLLRRPAALAGSLVLFTVICALLATPILLAGFSPDSGIGVYSVRWEMNDALFMVILWGAKVISAAHGTIIARGFVVAILLLLIVLLSRKPAESPEGMWTKVLVLVTALFLLSPTQFPWYYLWILPFLVLRPRASLLLWTALLPLYYLRFHFRARGQVAIFDYGIVWVEFVPVWALLIWERLRGRRGAVSAGEGE